MAYILSIIANPANPVIDDSLKSRIESIISGAVFDELSAGAAYDVRLDEADNDLLTGIRREMAEAPVDINIVPLNDRRKKLLIADMDSTIIEQECIDELADFIGLRDEISKITERAMRGELEFEEALRERVRMLAGVPTTALAETFEKKITLTPGAKTIIGTMNAMGAFTALVSGGFTFFTDRVAKMASFQTSQANELVCEDGKLTGEVREPILGRAAKQNALLRLCGEQDIALEQTIAVGDGANDLSMLERSSLGVAYHAKPAVAAAAHARIDHGDLTALLYLQGIPQSEFSEQ